MIERQGINWFCDQNGCKYRFTFSAGDSSRAIYSHSGHISRVASKDAILNFGSSRNGSNLVLSMFQDHPVDDNFETFRLGRVLGRQEASLIAKNRKNDQRTHTHSHKAIGTWDELRLISFSRALEWTKKIRKTAADIFAKFELEKPTKKPEKI